MIIQKIITKACITKLPVRGLEIAFLRMLISSSQIITEWLFIIFLWEEGSWKNTPHLIIQMSYCLLSSSHSIQNTTLKES